jgi:hypothetical protein
MRGTKFRTCPILSVPVLCRRSSEMTKGRRTALIMPGSRVRVPPQLLLKML